jgi:hypothetical protein
MRIPIHILLIITVLVMISDQQANAITQFYFAIPKGIKDTKGVTFSVNVGSKLFSWIDNGTSLIPTGKNTFDTQPDDTNIDLQTNEYLLAINKNLAVGTRVYMCIHIPSSSEEQICQTDAIDNHHLARVSFK